jgi:hypothetical protein
MSSATQRIKVASVREVAGDCGSASPR